MTNAEKFNDKIIDIALAGDTLAVNKRTLEPCGCKNIRCIDCIGAAENCEKELRKWANEEYKETCPFEKDELVEVSNDGTEWFLRHFSHEAYGSYYAYTNGQKSTDGVCRCRWEYCKKYGTLGGLVKEETE